MRKNARFKIISYFCGVMNKQYFIISLKKEVFVSCFLIGLFFALLDRLLLILLERFDAADLGVPAQVVAGPNVIGERGCDVLVVVTQQRCASSSLLTDNT